VHTTSLPGACAPNYLPLEPPYACYGSVSGGTTNPAFWEFGTTNHYSEVDGFEFGNSPWEDSQTTHEFIQADQCSIPTDAGTTDFSNGQPHTFYLITTPDEIDWYVDNTLTRADTRYYVSSSPFLTPTPTPYYSNTIVPGNPFWFTPYVFPKQPWQLIADNAIQHIGPPYDQNFPVDFHVQSIKYYEYFGGGCNDGAFSGFFNQVNVVQSMLTESRFTSTRPFPDPPDDDNYDVFVGGTVNLNGPINITTTRYPNQAWWLSQLKLIGESSVVISGSNSISGYFEAKVKAGICEGDYDGPLPFNAMNEHKAIKPPNKDSGSNGSYTKPIDSLEMSVNPAINHGQFTIILSNVEQNQNADVMVYNMLGQQLYHGNVIVQEGNILSIDISNQARGVYLVVVKTNYTILHKSVVVQ
jgi:hypothetical protein